MLLKAPNRPNLVSQKIQNSGPTDYCSFLNYQAKNDSSFKNRKITQLIIISFFVVADVIV